jgi:hypothetical protein
MAKQKGTTIMGFKSKAKPAKCKFGKNKNSGKCLKYPRK